jgi:hypothetical protein
MRRPGGGTVRDIGVECNEIEKLFESTRRYQLSELLREVWIGIFVNGLAIIGNLNHKMRSLRIELSPSTAASKSKPLIDNKVMDHLFQTLHHRVRTSARALETAHQCQVARDKRRNPRYYCDFSIASWYFNRVNSNRRASCPYVDCTLGGRALPARVLPLM